MSDVKSEEKYKVLRVTQFDAETLDRGIYDLLRRFLLESLKERPLTFLLNFEPEISACLRFILWNFTVKKYSRTIGQEILGTEFVATDGRPVTRIQTYLFGGHVVLTKWLKDRQDTFLKIANSDTAAVYIRKTLLWLQVLGQLVSLLNFLQFLVKGDHLNVIEHISHLKHVYSKKPSPRYIDFQYKRKELTWEKITEMILCVMPFINFHRIANTINRLVSTYTKSSSGEAVDTPRSLMCGVCGDLSTNPHCGECGHVYCYYCIKSNVEMAGSFDCLVCSSRISHVTPVVYERPAVLSDNP